MHPDLADLLNLRDGLDPAGPAAQHVADCPQCRAELERLQRLRFAMLSLPTPTGADHWPEIAARLADNRVARQLPRPSWRLAGSFAAVLAVVVGLAFFNGSTPRVNGTTPLAGEGTPTTSARPADSVTALMEESKRLESLLATIPDEPRVARAATVMTAAGLEDRIEWVDLALGAGDASAFDSSSVAPLWRQRVDLLNSLVAVRYAQVRTASY